MSSTRRATPATGCGVLGILLLLGCSGANDPEPSPPPPATATSGPVTSAEPVALPDTPVGRKARWVLGELADGDGPTPAEAHENFARQFLTEVPAKNVSGVFDDLRRRGPWQPVDVNTAHGNAVVGLRDGAGRDWRMELAVNADGELTTLLIRPAAAADTTEPAQNWAELHERLTSFDAEVGLLAAEVGTDGTCEPITALHPREPQPMASIFKLYVLGALVDATEAGHVNWSDDLTITDDVRSLPSGQLQDRPDGSTVAVSQAAAGMIAVSDNTGADLIAQLVGRAAVETAQADMGHAEPQLNEPFLTTREFFALGWGPAARRERWEHAGENARREFLDELPSGELQVSARDVTDPAWDDGIDWFGSPADICAALVSLHDDHSGADARMLRTVLGHNRGVSIDKETWPYVAFKGGSAPGVVTGSWYGERADGARFVFVMQAAAHEAAATSDHETFFGLAEDAFSLLATAD